MHFWICLGWKYALHLDFVDVTHTHVLTMTATVEPQGSDGRGGLGASGKPWSCCDISKQPLSGTGRRPLTGFHFYRASAHIHTRRQNKQWQGREELQTPHPACVKINLFKGGDVFVSLTIMETSMSTPHRRTICVLIKEFHYTAWTMFVFQ